MDSWRKKIENNIYEECNFQPQINENIFKYDSRKAEDIVVNPEALNFFVNRNLAKKKQDVAWKEIVDKRPGNGAVYINKLTIPHNIKLCTSKLDNIDEQSKMKDSLFPKRGFSENNKKRLSMDSFEIEVKILIFIIKKINFFKSNFILK